MKSVNAQRNLDCFMHYYSLVRSQFGFVSFRKTLTKQRTQYEDKSFDSRLSSVFHILQSSVERADSNGAEEIITKTEKSAIEKSEKSGTKKKSKKSKKSADSEKENISVVNGKLIFNIYLHVCVSVFTV